MASVAVSSPPNAIAATTGVSGRKTLRRKLSTASSSANNDESKSSDNDPPYASSSSILSSDVHASSAHKSNSNTPAVTPAGVGGAAAAAPGTTPAPVVAPTPVSSSTTALSRNTPQQPIHAYYYNKQREQSLFPVFEIKNLFGGRRHALRLKPSQVRLVVYSPTQFYTLQETLRQKGCVTDGTLRVNYTDMLRELLQGMEENTGMTNEVTEEEEEVEEIELELEQSMQQAGNEENVPPELHNRKIEISESTDANDRDDRTDPVKIDGDTAERERDDSLPQVDNSDEEELSLVLRVKEIKEAVAKQTFVDDEFDENRKEKEYKVEVDVLDEREASKVEQEKEYSNDLAATSIQMEKNFDFEDRTDTQQINDMHADLRESLEQETETDTVCKREDTLLDAEEEIEMAVATFLEHFAELETSASGTQKVLDVTDLSRLDEDDDPEHEEVARQITTSDTDMEQHASSAADVTDPRDTSHTSDDVILNDAEDNKSNSQASSISDDWSFNADESCPKELDGVVIEGYQMTKEEAVSETVAKEGVEAHATSILLRDDEVHDEDAQDDVQMEGEFEARVSRENRGVNDSEQRDDRNDFILSALDEIESSLIGQHKPYVNPSPTAIIDTIHLNYSDFEKFESGHDDDGSLIDEDDYYFQSTYLETPQQRARSYVRAMVQTPSKPWAEDAGKDAEFRNFCEEVTPSRPMDFDSLWEEEMDDAVMPLTASQSNIKTRYTPDTPKSSNRRLDAESFKKNYQHSDSMASPWPSRKEKKLSVQTERKPVEPAAIQETPSKSSVPDEKLTENLAFHSDHFVSPAPQKKPSTSPPLHKKTLVTSASDKHPSKSVAPPEQPLEVGTPGLPPKRIKRKLKTTFVSTTLEI